MAVMLRADSRTKRISSHLGAPISTAANATACSKCTAVPISGTIAPGWEPVRQAFADNFAERDELGAAVCVTWRGQVVVDLWGGIADPTRQSRWERNTVVNVFSSTKGLIALGANILADQGLLRIDDKVAKYWPEFGTAGKACLTVAQLLSHGAGLMAVEGESNFSLMLGPEGFDRTVVALGAATPAWLPEEDLFAYHGMTFGHLAGALIEKVSGQRLLLFLTKHLLQPLGAEVYIGLPDSVVAAGRVAPIVNGDGSTDKGTAGLFNQQAVRQAVIPSANGHTNGRSLALLYAAVANSHQPPPQPPPQQPQQQQQQQQQQQTQHGSAAATAGIISREQIDLMRSTHSPTQSYDDGTGDAVALGMRFGLGFRLSAANQPGRSIDNYYAGGGLSACTGSNRNGAQPPLMPCWCLLAAGGK